MYTLSSFIFNFLADFDAKKTDIFGDILKKDNAGTAGIPSLNLLLLPYVNILYRVCMFVHAALPAISLATAQCTRGSITLKGSQPAFCYMCMYVQRAYL